MLIRVEFKLFYGSIGDPEDFALTVLMSVVVAIPEGLPLAVTLSLVCIYERYLGNILYKI